MGPTDFELQSVRTVTNNDLDNDAHRPHQSVSLSKGSPVLKTRLFPLFVFLPYLTILIVPWVLTCILMNRPLTRQSYIDQSGSVGPPEINRWEKSVFALVAINTISGVIGLPVVSCLLAYGAVVYCQRRSPEQKLSVVQLFALADREWLNPIFFLCKNPFKYSSSYVFLASVLMLITAVQPLVHTILVQYENIRVVTCEGHPRNFFQDNNGCTSGGNNNDRNIQVVAWDADPAVLDICPHNLVVQKTNYKLRTMDVGKDYSQKYLWSDSQSPKYGERAQNYSLSQYYRGNSLQERYFVSSVANGTSTGVYRHHAVRMDSTAKCSKETTFPKSCKGERPFQTSLSVGTLKIDICVEGSYDTAPWRKLRDKQEHSERMWLAWTYNDDDDDDDELDESDRTGFPRQTSEFNYVLKCESESRRGWFELPSNINGFNAGPLLDKWPSRDEIMNDYNDIWVIPYSDMNAYPTNDGPQVRDLRDDFSIWQSDAFGSRRLSTPGPLMTSALAWVGNGTFFYTAGLADKNSYAQAMNDICSQSAMPYFENDFALNIADHCSPKLLSERRQSNQTWTSAMEMFMAEYFLRFNDEERTAKWLEMAMYFANEALLTSSGTSNRGRPIYFHPGTIITKLKRKPVAVIVISILLGLQVIGLSFLMWFIFRAPTWTDTLDADALAQIGGQLKQWGEPRPKLSQISGVIGVDRTGNDAETSTVRLSTVQDDSHRPRGIHLELGGEGLVTRSALKRMNADTTLE